MSVMIFKKTYLSIGDFIDLFVKIKEKRLIELISKLHLSNQDRTISKWNSIAASSDFWMIPEVRERWNEKCTGNTTIEYEDYVVSKYLSNANGLKMLSVGCGTGSRERKFGKYRNFDLIEGIDISENQIIEARKHASESGFNNIRYIAGDFMKHEFVPSAYDLILFNSSLHHFRNIDHLLQFKVLPLLKNGGYVVIFEYVGPNRLQWINLQLEYANKLLKELPHKYKLRFKSQSIKRKIYRPGILRMLLVDPSEAVDSESIIPSIHKYFKTLEEKRAGWDITHLLFKDIAHNFLNSEEETKSLLSYLFDKEDEYLSLTNRSDSIFGVYQK
jgi:ubiquinone/menaquinone biosynthesis C-methylase UbiE